MEIGTVLVVSLVVVVVNPTVVVRVLAVQVVVVVVQSVGDITEELVTMKKVLSTHKFQFQFSDQMH